MPPDWAQAGLKGGFGVETAGLVLLAIWLIITGLKSFTSFRVGEQIMALLALLAGILIFLGILI